MSREGGWARIGKGFRRRPGNNVTRRSPSRRATADLQAEYGIFDVFPDGGGRFAHLTGHVPRELAKHALSLLGSVPDPDLPSVLASKLGA